MLKILQPFEITDGHSSGVAEDIGKEPDSLSQANLLSFDSGGPISSLNDNSAFETMGVTSID
jgi:hypothetical protein